MKKTLKLHTETPPDLSSMPGYVEYYWYDGPILYSVGSKTERYLFMAMGDDEKSKAENTLRYLVVPMTLKRELDIFENKLSLRQAFVHSRSKLFMTYDYGKTYEEFNLNRPDRNHYLAEPGIRFSLRPRESLKMKKRRSQKRKNTKI